MFEENINAVVDQTNDQLDILKEYIRYRTTFHVERTLNRLRVLSSLGCFSGRIEISDVTPIKFDILKGIYLDGMKKDSITKAVRISITELDKSIEDLMKVV